MFTKQKIWASFNKKAFAHNKFFYIIINLKFLGLFAMPADLKIEKLTY
jgi:hypothetical protein